MSRTKATPDVANIASQGEAESGVATDKFMTPERTKQAVEALALPQSRPIGFACSDEATALTTGAAKLTFHPPVNWVVTGVVAELATVQTSGSIFTVDINVAGVSILSTKLTIDNGEETSLTAATPAVQTGNPNLITAGQKVTIDIDQVGDGTAKGLKVWLLGYPSA